MERLSIRPFSDGEFPELDALHSLIQRGAPALRSDVVCEISAGNARLPIHCLELGAASSEVPVVGFFGGIHGVERIGAQVILAFLHSLIERLQWDDALAQMLERVRLVFMPLVNPGGFRNRTRANPSGVDLMRNAPVDAEEDAHWLLGGHRLSHHLPWYRGHEGEPMQPEAQALCRVVEERLFPAPFCLSIDCHSGFGLTDRVWFPYAKSHRPIECLAEIYALRTMFRTTHPYHSIYVIEPQAHQYTTHGDLWDHLYERSRRVAARPFIPLTLEMGSWLWVKKSPAQIFSVLGMFNPAATHRHERTLRRHLPFFDFLVRAAISHERWRPSEAARTTLNEAATAYWYQPRSIPQEVPLVRE
ncbi:MAG TPA: M14 family zinc carboxypeptidase [Nevskiaceae bacterium]|nr:M14 family zinc carboxypeptidase [Nevskiaceae bacterium]